MATSEQPHGSQLRHQLWSTLRPQGARGHTKGQEGPHWPSPLSGVGEVVEQRGVVLQKCSVWQQDSGQCINRCAARARSGGVRAS